MTHAHDDLLAKFSSVPKLKCLMFTEFDPEIGPVITYQVRSLIHLYSQNLTIGYDDNWEK